jgi:hypothetical protein
MNPIEWKNRFLPRDMQTLVNDTVPEMADTQMSRLIQRTADFVKEKLQANDASHDWRHIERVWKLARTIAREEVLEVSFLYRRYLHSDCTLCYLLFNGRKFLKKTWKLLI